MMRPIAALRRFVVWFRGATLARTSVDLPELSEAEYPVFCARCGYELRGLPDSRCPECGETFNRTRLLVDQYVRCRRPRTDVRHRVGRWLDTAAWALLLTPPVALWILGTITLRWSSRFPWLYSTDWVLRIVRAAIGLQILGAVCMVVAIVLVYATIPPRSKRRAVQTALRKRRYDTRTTQR